MHLVTLILSVAVHEFAHAYVADLLGDDLPSRQGRLTLNPLAHADPIGTLLIPAISSVAPVPLFGWGRPVETNPTSYTRKVSMRGGMALVSFAGPASNLLMSIVCAVLWSVLGRFNVITWDSAFSVFLVTMVSLNLTLFVFNLIPVPPLDGSKIASWIFGYRADKLLDQLASLGMFAVYGVVLLGGSFIGWFTNRGVHLLLSFRDVLS
jgi:Zn-dependent protease